MFKRLFTGLTDVVQSATTAAVQSTTPQEPLRPPTAVGGQQGGSSSNLDLSGLSEEEKARILSVVEKAETQLSTSSEAIFGRKSPDSAISYSAPKSVSSMSIASSVASDRQSSFLSRSGATSDMDLSGLSDEEKTKIFSVMQRSERELPLPLTSSIKTSPELIQPQPQAKGGATKSVNVEVQKTKEAEMAQNLGLDLSGLTLEEQRKILSVMAAAEDDQSNFALAARFEEKCPNGKNVAQSIAETEPQPRLMYPQPVVQKTEYFPQLQKHKYEMHSVPQSPIADVDLSGFSEEERQQIMSVMMKAEMMGGAVEQETIKKTPSVDQKQFADNTAMNTSTSTATARRSAPAAEPAEASLDGLTEEEKRQILAVMKKAEESGGRIETSPKPPLVVDSSTKISAMKSTDQKQTVSTAVQPTKRDKLHSISSPTLPPELDLSGLSDEDREHILTVMRMAEEAGPPSSFPPPVQQKPLVAIKPQSFNTVVDTVSSNTVYSTTVDHQYPNQVCEIVAYVDKNARMMESESDYYSHDQQHGYPDVDSYQEDQRDVYSDEYDYQETPQIKGSQDQYERQSSEETEGADDKEVSEEEEEEQAENMEYDSISAPNKNNSYGADEAVVSEPTLINDIDLDLTGLSEEEKRHILLVMNRAKQTDFSSSSFQPALIEQKSQHQNYPPILSRNMSNEEEEEEERSKMRDYTSTSSEVSGKRRSSQPSSFPTIEEPEEWEEDESEDNYGIRFQYEAEPDRYSQTAVPIVVHPPSPGFSEGKEFDYHESEHDNETYSETDGYTEYSEEIADRHRHGYDDHYNEESDAQDMDLHHPELNMNNVCIARTPEGQNECVEVEESFSAPLRHSFDLEDDYTDNTNINRMIISGSEENIVAEEEEEEEEDTSKIGDVYSMQEFVQESYEVVGTFTAEQDDRNMHVHRGFCEYQTDPYDNEYYQSEIVDNNNENEEVIEEMPQEQNNTYDESAYDHQNEVEQPNQDKYYYDEQPGEPVDKQYEYYQDSNEPDNFQYQHQETYDNVDDQETSYYNNQQQQHLDDKYWAETNYEDKSYEEEVVPSPIEPVQSNSFMHNDEIYYNRDDSETDQNSSYSTNIVEAPILAEQQQHKQFPINGSGAQNQNLEFFDEADEYGAHVAGDEFEKNVAAQSVYEEENTRNEERHDAEHSDESQSTEGPDDNETYRQDLSPVSENEIAFDKAAETTRVQEFKIEDTMYAKPVDIPVIPAVMSKSMDQSVAATSTERSYSSKEAMSQQQQQQIVSNVIPKNENEYLAEQQRIHKQEEQRRNESKSSSSFFSSSSIMNVKKLTFSGFSSALKTQTEQVIKKATTPAAFYSAPPSPLSQYPSTANKKAPLAADVEDNFGIDLTGLSAEEREHILAVMAKANETPSAAPTIAPSQSNTSLIEMKPFIEDDHREAEMTVCRDEKTSQMAGFGSSYGSESSHETEDTGYVSRNSPFEDEETCDFSHETINAPSIDIPETIIEDTRYMKEDESSSIPIVQPSQQVSPRTAATYNPFLFEAEDIPELATHKAEPSIPGMPDLDLSQFNEEERQHLLAMFYKANEMEHEIVDQSPKPPTTRQSATPQQLMLPERTIPIIREIQPTPEAVYDFDKQFKQRTYEETIVTSSGESVNTKMSSDELVSQSQQYDSSEVSSDINDEEQQKRIKEIEAELSESNSYSSEEYDKCSKLELCPLCAKSTIEYTVDGQNVTGQTCAYCSTVVCTNCGRVHNITENKTLWLCILCLIHCESDGDYSADLESQSSMKEDFSSMLSTSQSTIRATSATVIRQSEIPEMTIVTEPSEDNYETRRTIPRSNVFAVATSTTTADNVLIPRKKQREDGDSDDSDEETSSTSDDDYPDEVIEVPSEPSSLRESRLESETETDSISEVVGGDVLAEIAKTFSTSMSDFDFDLSPRIKPATIAQSQINYSSTNPFVQVAAQPPPIPARGQQARPLPTSSSTVQSIQTASASGVAAMGPLTVIALDHEPYSANSHHEIEMREAENVEESTDNGVDIKLVEDDIDYTQALKYYNSQPFYTHRSGPVYTIPEDEEEVEEQSRIEKRVDYEETSESYSTSPRLSLITPVDELDYISPGSPSPSPISATNSFILCAETKPSTVGGGAVETGPFTIIATTDDVALTKTDSASSPSSSFYISCSSVSIGEQASFPSLPYFTGSRSGGQLVRDVTSLVSSQYYFIQKAQTEQHLAAAYNAATPSTAAAVSKQEPRPIRTAPLPPLSIYDASSSYSAPSSISYYSSMYSVSTASAASALPSVPGQRSTISDIASSTTYGAYQTTSYRNDTSRSTIYATPNNSFQTEQSKNSSSQETQPRTYSDWSTTSGDLTISTIAARSSARNDPSSTSESSSYDNLKKFEVRALIGEDNHSSAVGNVAAASASTSTEEHDGFVSRLKRSPAMILHSGEERRVDQSSNLGYARFRNPFLPDSSAEQQRGDLESSYSKDEQPHRTGEMGRRRLPDIPQTAAPFQQTSVDDSYSQQQRRWKEREANLYNAAVSTSSSSSTSSRKASTDQRQRLVQGSGSLKMPATLARVLLKQELREALSRRMQQLEACEIEANQRQYAVQRHILTGIYPRSIGIDSAPARVKCSLPAELVEGIRIEMRPFSKEMQSDLVKSPRRSAETFSYPSYSFAESSVTNASVQTSAVSKPAKKADWERDRSNIDRERSNLERERSSIVSRIPAEWERSYKTPTVRESSTTMTGDWNRGIGRFGTDTTGRSFQQASTLVTFPCRDAETQTSTHSTISTGPAFPYERSLTTYSRQYSTINENDFVTGRSTYYTGRTNYPSTSAPTLKTPTKSVSTNTEREDPFSLRDSDLARKARKSRSRRMTNSTYFSDDDDSTSREMRKSKIREEIARRREKLSALSSASDLREFYRPSDYSSHVPHYGSLPRIDFPQNVDKNYGSLPRFAPPPYPATVDTFGSTLQPYHKVHPMYHSDLGYLSDVQDYGRQLNTGGYRTPTFPQNQFGQRYMSRSLPYLDQLDRYYSAEVPQSSNMPVRSDPLPDSGLLSHYANYLNEQFLNRPSTSNDYAFSNQALHLSQRYPSSQYYTGTGSSYDQYPSTLGSYSSQNTMQQQPQIQQQPYPLQQQTLQQPWLDTAAHSTSYGPSTQYRPYTGAAGYGLQPTQRYQTGNMAAQPGPSSLWTPSTWKSSSAYGSNLRNPNWRASTGQTTFDTLLNRNDSGYSSAGGYLSDSTFRRGGDYRGPTDINELYTGQLNNNNNKLQQFGGGISKGQQRQHMQPPTITVCNDVTPEATIYNNSSSSNNYRRHVNSNATKNNRCIQKRGAVKRILLTRDPKDRSVKGHGLGMKVIGGKILPNGDGELGAYVAAVYKGGLVDTMGEVREGDQILEWNGISLSSKTFEEVQRIIDSSEGEVEIVVRSGANLNRVYELEKQSKSMDKGYESGSGVNVNVNGRNEDLDEASANASAFMYEFLDGNASPCFSTTPRSGGSPLQAHFISGHLCVSISFDDETCTLFVSVVAAADLRARCHIRSGYPNPFVKVYLLPSRRVENKRRTKYIQGTCNPEWNQTVVYKDLSRTQLFSSYLEFTVWDYDRFEDNEFLGRVFLPLADPAVISNRARWYPLQPLVVRPNVFYGHESERVEYVGTARGQFPDSFPMTIRRNNMIDYDDLLLQIQRQ